jgi:hypothetical protein
MEEYGRMAKLVVYKNDYIVDQIANLEFLEIG